MTGQDHTTLKVVRAKIAGQAQVHFLFVESLSSVICKTKMHTGSLSRLCCVSTVPQT